MNNLLVWLQEDAPLSNMGDLKATDFILLAKTLVNLEHPEFNDAKSQFAASFRKLGAMTEETEAILLQFYNDPDEYTKRQALMSLGKLNYSDIRSLIAKSWDEIEDEHHKIGCLSVVQNLNDPQLTKHYLALVAQQEGEYLKAYAERLKITFK